MTEENVLKILTDNDRDTVQSVCDALRNYDGVALSCIADFVAALCNIEKEDMFSGSSILSVSQARWLFWYAYRYMTNETYEKIGKEMEFLYGRKFSQFGVSAGVNKMSALIEKEPVWKRRWAIIKRIIKEYNSIDKCEPVKVFVPKNVNIEVIKG